MPLREKEYPPVYLTPGEYQTITGPKEAIEIHCEEDPKVLDFIEAMANLRMFEKDTFRAAMDTNSHNALRATVERTWNDLPVRIFMAIERRVK